MSGGGGEGNSSNSFQQRRKRSESIGGLKVCCVQESLFDLAGREGDDKKEKKVERVWIVEDDVRERE